MSLEHRDEPTNSHKMSLQRRARLPHQMRRRHTHDLELTHQVECHVPVLPELRLAHQRVFGKPLVLLQRHRLHAREVEEALLRHEAPVKPRLGRRKRRVVLRHRQLILFRYNEGVRGRRVT